MQRRNSEALTTCDSQGLGVSNLLRETNMNIVAKSDLNFQGIQLQPVAAIDGTWLTASQLGYALQYADDKAVQRIYSRHADEFTEKMTGVVRVATPYGDQMTRVFSLRGAHLIAMFARTPVAKEFRRWVLDILDREVAGGNVNPAFDFKMHVHNINAACIHLEVMRDIWCNELDPALRTLGSPIAAKTVDRLKDAIAQVNGVRNGMERASGLKGLQYH